MTSELEIILRVALAGALGAVVGFDRQLRDKPAGMRTHMLVAMGAALFVGITLLFVEEAVAERPDSAGDPLRVVAVVAAVATGIGFLGAGAIIRGEGRVRGLTTAAGIWVTAALGVVVGLGFYLIAVVATAAAATIIALLGFVEPRRQRTTGSEGGG